MSSRLSRGGAAAFIVVSALLLGQQLLGSHPCTSNGNRITILYDAFGKPSAMTQDWGYSALLEYGGKRILFDTGNNPRIFAKNVKAAGVNLKTLDAVVISHRHLDHTAGLNHLLGVNPDVKIYAPREAFGPFGGSIPSKFYRRQDSLPREMRYFDGHPEEEFTSGVRMAFGQVRDCGLHHRDQPGSSPDLPHLGRHRDQGAARALAGHRHTARAWSS